MVDVVTDIEIARPVHEVAAYVADPANAPEWYVNIDSVEWESEPVVAVGSKATFVARFLVRTLRSTDELVEVDGEFGALVSPFMGRAMARANRKDLRTLESLLER